MSFTTIPGVAKLRAAILSSLITEVRPIAALKSGDQTTTTTTIADDTELQISLSASTTYEGFLYLIHNFPAAADLKLQFSVPSGASGYWNPMVQNLAATAGTVYQGALAINAQAQLEGQAAETFLHAWFIITTTNAGTFKVQYAENAASGTGTVRAGSLLVARKAV